MFIEHFLFHTPYQTIYIKHIYQVPKSDAFFQPSAPLGVKKREPTVPSDVDERIESGALEAVLVCGMTWHGVE